MVWAAPTNTGPAITGYDVRYRTVGSVSWTPGPGPGPGTNRQATIDKLTGAQAYEVQVRAVNSEGRSGWSASERGTPTANQDPAITTNKAQSVTENTADIGLAATNDDDGALQWAVTGGADEALFDVTVDPGDSKKATLSFDTAPDFENPADTDSDNVYVVTVSVTDAHGATDTETFTITVTNAVEVPDAPDAPTVTPGVLKLGVVWAAPTNTGRPAITGYEVQYRVRGSSGVWTPGPGPGPDRQATIDKLTGAQAYEVQVRAVNAEGRSGWSASTSGTPTVNQNPAITTNAAQSVTENTADVGLGATNDDDGVLAWAITGGADEDLFTVTVDPTDSKKATLSFDTAPNFENPADTDTNNAYVVAVTVTDIHGATTARTFTITVTNAVEVPDAPGAPTVTPGVLSLGVVWAAPANTGPAITGYEVQYRVSGGSGVWTPGPGPGTNRQATIDKLTGAQAYEVQVRAVNSEGRSGWSASERGTPTANQDPAITTNKAQSVTENTADIGLAATNDDDGALQWAVTGGADEALFDVTVDPGDSKKATLSFDTAPDFENHC